MFIRLTFGNNKAQPPHTARPIWLSESDLRMSVVAECNAWSVGKVPKPHGLQLCAPVTKVRKRGGRPQPPASQKPGITATLTKRSQDPTLPRVSDNVGPNWRVGDCFVQVAGL